MQRLIINNIQIELEPSKPIARTLQVNDIASLNNRQANFTPTFSIPRTANNIKAFEKLGIIGINSQVPYQRNEAYYYAESGECLIYKGWAVITATEKAFRCNLYDGAIDLYKAIENATLANLPLDEINHVKTLENVVDSINGLTTYKYIIADYNGKALYDGNKINIDYLVPSVPVSYLWDKIFDFYGFTYSGTVFNSFAFQNWYMSFPKGIGSTEPDEEYFDGSGEAPPYQIEFLTQKSKRRYFVFDTPALSNGTTIFNQKHTKPNTAGLYRLEVSGSIDIFSIFTNNCKLNYALNTDAFDNPNNITTFTEIATIPVNNGTQTVSVNILVQLQESDSISFFLRSNQLINSTSGSLNFKLSKVESSNIDFTGVFIDLKTKDFFNEVLTRFGLTPFKDKYTNNITFKTLYEILQDSDTIDWSSKFDSVNSESYAYGSYAQVNNFVYKYNDNESDYYNGSINIENVNLPDTKDAIKSVIYAPDRVRTNELFKSTNVYRLWNKEPKEDGTVNYKSLDKRFYFMRIENFIFPEAVTIGSETLAVETTIGQAPYESFFKLPFNDVIQDYYLPIYQILNNAKIINANIFLKEQDIVNIDFSKLVWIKQLGNYFLLNKIMNFQGNGITKCELIKVDYVPIITQDFNDLPLAVNDEYEVNNFDVIQLNVLDNDFLGFEPTEIISFDDSGLTSGTITNNGTSLTFTPNGIFDVNETFTYTIRDFLLNESTATVTLNVVEAIIEDGFRTLGFISSVGICDNEDFLTCKFKLAISGIIQDGDICLNNDETPFDGNDFNYRVYLDSVPTDSYSIVIDDNGVITVNNLC
jgi:hypothetical protein